MTENKNTENKNKNPLNDLFPKNDKGKKGFNF